ncbi:hypothetical protein F8G81_01840 [Arthrobacter sp. CDRTa11]|jgi:hypothetical protein|uniref:hypothetical protein n=1 Tax=Arthrobacter sp. CDRTa11 TaxID=2651199 RepID=UPI002265F44B|nr:hypothetical protein [Arthrobacter sp. CDRTa11]UZX01500.1 hypothetical protein F8G81_01840 [Arthrobacter sp. CDRTa11]
MKKLTTALLATGLVLSASACTASTQLSTPETCDRIKSVVANPPVGKSGMTRMANQFRPIEVVASDDLKSALQSIIEYTDESAKETPDEEKLSGLQADYEAAGGTFSKFCS